MAFIEMNISSRVLHVACPVNVILPQPKKDMGPPRVLYLLHGYSDDHSRWMRSMSTERYAVAHNMAVIMPAVNHSFYANELHGERYWDYVSQELPALMHRYFRLSDRPEDTFVAGNSMGGYGALKLAMTYPERFAAAGCFSGAVDLVAGAQRKSGVRLEGFRRVFGDLDALPGSEHDLYHLMEKSASAPRKPRLFITCGTADFLYEDNLRFLPALEKHGWDVTSAFHEGREHEEGYWDEQIKAFIPWAVK